MSTVTDQLGLDAPRPPAAGSTEQADQFRAQFQAEQGPINDALQYTAAHAEQAKHQPLAAKRDKTCSAYQVALGRIDPTNPAVAQGAIDQVLAAVKSLRTAVESLRQAVEKAFDAWTGRETDLDAAAEQVREMAEWGYEKATALEQVVEAIGGKANARNWAEALQALELLLQKITPLYDDFKQQKAAQEQYDADLPDFDTQLAEVATCEFASLEEESVKIVEAADSMRELAAAKDYVAALVQLETLRDRVADYLARLEELRAKKEEFEQARTDLEPRLSEASTSEFELLAKLDQQIAETTTQMDEAAAADDYEQALQLASELSAKVDEKLQRAEELAAAKEEYETGRATLDPRLAEASVSKHESLAADEEKIATLTSEMDAAVSSGDFVAARDKMHALTSLVEKNLADEAQLDRKIIGSAQRDRASKKLEGLSEVDRERFNKLADDAKSPEELDYLTKALAANHSVDDIEAFAKKINGKDKDWLQNNLKLTGDTSGEGVKQQWGHSCNATTVQAVRGELDPIYALKLHEENTDLSDADDSDGAKTNPKLAAEQKKMLESEYTGDFAGKHEGEAVKRDDVHTDGSGRFADDLLNDMSETTGVEYKTERIDTTYDFDKAAADVDAGVSKGHPVPLIVGKAKSDTATSGEYTTSHYVLVTGSDPGPPPTWTIHDPWEGKTVTHNVQDIKDGKADIGGGWKQLAAIENPSVK